MKVALLSAFLLVALPLSARAQDRDLVVRLGASWESYSGNFSAVTLPLVDSTRRATAAIGEFSARGHRTFQLNDRRSLDLGFDGGLRQFAALGFQLRDYAPREWVSQLDGVYTETFDDLGTLSLGGSYRQRAIEDRPPMPLFLQPAYRSVRGSARFRFNRIQGVRFDAQGNLERTNYDAPQALPHLDLLDRHSEGIEVGAVSGGERDWYVRFFSGLNFSQYQGQSGQDAEDPEAFRRDHAISLGAQWCLCSMERALTASVGLEGTRNRSNSDRPEYDAVSVTGDLFTPLPWWNLKLNTNALLTGKTYVHETPFARLVPGEEADNASVVYMTLIRTVAANLDAHLRFGWTRAETDIGNSYYNRFGTTLLFNFRPGG